MSQPGQRYVCGVCLSSFVAASYSRLMRSVHVIAASGCPYREEHGR